MYLEVRLAPRIPRFGWHTLLTVYQTCLTITGHCNHAYRDPVYDLLQTMTMKKIRQQLNAVFKVDLSDRKDFLAAQVYFCLLEMHLRVLQSCQEQLSQLCPHVC